MCAATAPARATITGSGDIEAPLQTAVATPTSTQAGVRIRKGSRIGPNRGLGAASVIGGLRNQKSLDRSVVVSQ